jgi:hypothetical protein
MGAAAALGNLSLEAILKHSVDGSRGVEQSIWLQNLVLYCYTATLTLLLWVLDVSIEHAHKNLFHGWDGKTWVLLLFQVNIYRHVPYRTLAYTTTTAAVLAKGGTIQRPTWRCYDGGTVEPHRAISMSNPSPYSFSRVALGGWRARRCRRGK